MDVEKLLRLVVNFVALVVLAVAAAVALVVAAKGDAGVGSRAPTVSPSLVSERSLALDRASRDPVPVARAADPTPNPKPKARPAVQRKSLSPARSSPGSAIQADHGWAEAEHEEEEHGDEEGGHDEEDHGDEGWEAGGGEGWEGDESDE